MSILTKVKGAVSSSATGYSATAGSPNNFQDPDDLNLFADIVATMGDAAGSGDSAAYVRLTYGVYPGFPTSPAATRTTRKLKFRGTLIAQLDAGAPTNSFVEAGFRYSLNGGGAWTDVIRYTNNTPNTAIGNGAPTDYEVVLPVGQNVSQLILEAFATADSGLGGTAGNSYARALAMHGYLEDYEEGVELLVVRPNDSDEIDFGGGGLSALTSLDPGYSRDGIESTYHRFQADLDPAVNDAVYGYDFVSNFPAVLVAQGVRHAQVIVVWEGYILADGCTPVTDEAYGEIVISWQGSTAGGYSSTTGAEGYLKLDGLNAGPTSYSVTGLRQRLVKDITAQFQTSDQVKTRIRNQANFLDTSGLPSDPEFAVDVNHYESYLELRLDSRYVASFDWEPV